MRWRAVLAGSALLDALRDHDPHVAGTFPLGLDLRSSDIDLLCHAPDGDAFARLLWGVASGYPDFTMRQWTGGTRAVIASFTIDDLPFEIFGDPRPVESQEGWLHFTVEQRLLELGGDRFHAAVMATRQTGAKTEPAFAQVLGVEGDPYAALAALSAKSDAVLGRLLATAGFTPQAG
ncbi:alpha/beta hydrolase [Croceicoccus mobilis]|uniref:Alpha/beta hydrolase n=1 Tax=Croceicoccus mobilis TaxID=1703339 RepID=A0A916Z212_9SPHN|nr:alpha/beta hydrolase [Croceicoccus mobilis]